VSAPTPLPDDELAAIEARHAAATPGPYKLYPPDGGDEFISLRAAVGLVADAAMGGAGPEGYPILRIERPEDALFLEGSWADVRDLLAEVKRQRGMTPDPEAGDA
jgi:hypothetical protein